MQREISQVLHIGYRPALTSCLGRFIKDIHGGPAEVQGPSLLTGVGSEKSNW